MPELPEVEVVRRGLDQWVTGRTVAAVEVHTRLAAPEPGTYLLGGSGLGTLRLTLDDQVAFDTVTELPTGADPVEALMRPPQRCRPPRRRCRS